MLLRFPWRITVCRTPSITRSSPRKTFTTTRTAYKRITVLKIAVFVFRSSSFYYIFAFTTTLRAFGASSSTKRWRSSWMRYRWGRFRNFPMTKQQLLRQMFSLNLLCHLVTVFRPFCIRSFVVQLQFVGPSGNVMLCLASYRTPSFHAKHS